MRLGGRVGASAGELEIGSRGSGQNGRQQPPFNFQVRATVRGTVRNEGGIRWRERGYFTVQTCWRVWRGAGSTVVPFDNF